MKLCFIKIQEQMRLKTLQSTFQELFMNPDISLGEAKVMLDRYKELDKIKDDKEYIKAVFEEAKKNFGFGNSKMELEFTPREFMQGALAGADTMFMHVKVVEDLPRYKVLETIHHELRHHKQHYFAYNHSPERYMDAVNKKIETKTGKKELWKDLTNFEACIKTYLQELPFSDNVPQDYVDFAEKSLDALYNYKDVLTDSKSYYKNFLEVDARTAERLIRRAMSL